MRRSTTRVLVVDDYEPWRRFVSSTLQRSAALHVVGEASDGLGAVQKAGDLQPDLILLDIGLPELNGIEAARRIRNLSPDSKIIFITENRAPEIANEALRSGGSGYLVKSSAGSELFDAIDTVLEGRRFVTHGLAGLIALDEHIEAHVPDENIVPRHNVSATTRHDVEFYSDDAAFVDGFARGIKAALKVGNPVIVIANESHRAAILDRLQADQVDVHSAIKNGNYRAGDPRDTLSAIMDGDMPDPALCSKVVNSLVQKACNGRGKDARVAIFGECAPTLLADGNAEAAVRLEHLWEEIARRCQADTLCGYLWSAFPEKENSRMFKRICAAHIASTEYN